MAIIIVQQPVYRAITPRHALIFFKSLLFVALIFIISTLTYIKDVINNLTEINTSYL